MCVVYILRPSRSLLILVLLVGKYHFIYVMFNSTQVISASSRSITIYWL